VDQWRWQTAQLDDPLGDAPRQLHVQKLRVPDTLPHMGHTNTSNETGEFCGYAATGHTTHSMRRTSDMKAHDPAEVMLHLRLHYIGLRPWSAAIARPPHLLW
jgi:hypothetical protein